MTGVTNLLPGMYTQMCEALRVVCVVKRGIEGVSMLLVLEEGPGITNHDKNNIA